MRLLLLLSLSLAAWAQSLTVTAPWLVVYDAEGRPRWEIRLEKLWRTKEGWEGEGVSVTLFWAGEPSFKVQAQAIRAEALGRSWTLSGEIAGEGYGFSFTAEEASWDGKLRLKHFQAQGHGLSLVAQEARWELEGPLELFAAEGEGMGWSLRFPYGRFAEGVLVAQEPEAVGHGLRLRAELLELWVDEGRLKFRRVQVVRGS